jgi:hypothetical protein
MLQANREGEPKVDHRWLVEVHPKSAVANQRRRADDFRRGTDAKPSRCTILGRMC